MPSPLLVVLRRLLASRLVTQLLWPLGLAAPAILLAATQVQNLKAVEALLQPVRGFFNAHPSAAVICLAWPLLLTVLQWWLSPQIESLRRPVDRLNADELGALLRHFDAVVGAKMERFGKLAAQLRRRAGRSQSAADAFHAITQPDEQLRLLVEKVYQMFLQVCLTSQADRQLELRVVLARMTGRRVDKYEFFLPEHLGPATPLKTFQQPGGENNGFAAAVEGQLVIIPDIAFECEKTQGSRYAVSETDPRPSGSMICYAIPDRHTHSVPYVLSIKSPRKNQFAEESRKRYEYLLRPFAHRILLEHHLNFIKEKVS